MKFGRCFKLVVGAMIAIAAAGAKNEFSVRLKVINFSGNPIQEFEVRTHSHERGFAPWTKGKEGEILLRSKNDFPFFGRAMRYQVIVRAAGFAPAIIEMDRPEGDIERTVRLTKGQRIEMILTAKNGRAIPDSLIPRVIFPDFQDRVWLHFQHNKGEFAKFDYNFTSLVKVKPGHYTFNVAEDSPEIYVFVDHPGFIRAFRGGPFGKENLANGRLNIELPEPVSLEITFEPPKALLSSLPYAKCRSSVTRQDPDDEQRGFPICFIRSEIPRLNMNQEFLAPGNYWIELNTEPADSSKGFEWGRVNPAYYRDMRKYSLAPGQVEKVVFGYAAYDENSYKGNYSATINVQWHNGKPADGAAYTLYYMDRHFGYVTIKEGTIPDNGQIEITGLAGGEDTHFTLEIDKGKLGRYFFQLLGEEKTRGFRYKIAPLKGNVAPDINVLDIFTGEEVRLSDFRSRVLFVEFWATWCGPCQRPTSHLCEIATQRKADWEDKAVLVCVSLDNKKEDVIRYVRNRGWLGVRHLWSEESEPGFKSFGAKAYGITGVPIALLIDRSGRIVWRGHPGSFDIEENIDKLLKDK